MELASSAAIDTITELYIAVGRTATAEASTTASAKTSASSTTSAAAATAESTASAESSAAWGSSGNSSLSLRRGSVNLWCGAIVSEGLSGRSAAEWISGRSAGAKAERASGTAESEGVARLRRDSLAQTPVDEESLVGAAILV